MQLSKNNLIKKRLKKSRLVGKILARLPFVRSVILNGSLASGGHKKLSDIDILIIAKNGHIFSARFFVVLFAVIFRIKRPKEEFPISDNQCKKSVIVHAGKFCFNYFLTENFLKIPTGRGEEMDRYCADNYSKSKYIAGDIRLFEEFMLANEGLFRKYGYKIRNPKSEIRNKSKIQNSKSKTPPESFFWDWFENVVKNYQIKKIESDPRTKKYPTLIVYNDKELRFHPPKLESRIMNHESWEGQA